MQPYCIHCSCLHVLYSIWPKNHMYTVAYVIPVRGWVLCRFIQCMYSVLYNIWYFKKKFYITYLSIGHILVQNLQQLGCNWFKIIYLLHAYISFIFPGICNWTWRGLCIRMFCWGAQCWELNILIWKRIFFCIQGAIFTEWYSKDRIFLEWKKFSFPKI